jgi:MFS family permease
MVTLSLRARELSPEGSEYWLSLVLGVGALFALVGNPLAGWLSDRTTSSWGMRRPWLIGGALGGVASLWLVASAPSVGLTFKLPSFNSTNRWFVPQYIITNMIKLLIRSALGTNFIASIQYHYINHRMI